LAAGRECAHHVRLLERRSGQPAGRQVRAVIGAAGAVMTALDSSATAGPLDVVSAGASGVRAEPAPKSRPLHPARTGRIGLLADRFFLGCALVLADFLHEDLLRRERALGAFLKPFTSDQFDDGPPACRSVPVAIGTPGVGGGT
jgi:hypothetical protein